MISRMSEKVISNHITVYLKNYNSFKSEYKYTCRVEIFCFSSGQLLPSGAKDTKLNTRQITYGHFHVPFLASSLQI